MNNVTTTMKPWEGRNTINENFDILDNRLAAIEADVHIYTGNGAPSSTLGFNNDIYINLGNFQMHRKSGGAWSPQGSMIGSTGATILSTSDVPTNALGKEGDYHFNTSTKMFTGPKGVSTWPGSGVVLAGPPGLNFRGAWVSGTTYAVDDVVTVTAGAYRRKVAGAGTTAPNADTANYDPVVLRGATGAAGILPRGAWVSGTTYAVNDTVTYNGSQYRRTVAGAGTTPPDNDSANWSLFVEKGAAGLPNKGAWVSGTTYAEGDVVTSQGSAYSRRVAGAGTVVPANDSTNWALLVSKGDTGAGVVYRGAWVSGTTYAANDIILYNGMQYRRIAAGAGTVIPPNNSANWEFFLPGVIGGGTTGQLLAKNSNTDYDYKWIDPLIASSIGASVKDYGAVGNGVADDTTAIRNCIAANRVVYIPASASGYLVSGEIDIPDGTTIVGHGYPSRLIKRNVKVAHNILRGTNRTAGSKNITLQGVYIEGDWGTAEWNYVTPKDWEPGKAYAVGAIVKKNGLKTTEAVGQRVYKCITAGTSAAAGPTENPLVNQPVWDDTIDKEYQDNTVRWKEFAPAAEPFCIYFNANKPDTSNCENIHLRDCTITAYAGISYRINGVNNSQVIGCTAHRNLRGGIVFSRVGNDIVITGNQATDLGDDCIAVNSVQNSDNTVPSKDYGKVVISSNTCRSRNDAEFGAGVILRAGTGATIADNVLENHKNAAISVATTVIGGTNFLHPTNITISGNIILTTQGDGIELLAGSFNGIKIVENNVSYAGYHGIIVRHANTDANISGQDLDISDNRVRNAGRLVASGSSTMAYGIGITATAASTLRVFTCNNNTLRSCARAGLYLDAIITITGANVLGNLVDTCQTVQSTEGYAMQLGTVKFFNASNNTVMDTRGTKLHKRGINIGAGCTDGLVSNNLSLNAHADEATSGIVNGGTGITVTGNKVT